MLFSIRKNRICLNRLISITAFNLSNNYKPKRKSISCFKEYANVYSLTCITDDSRIMVLKT